jgi:hypothetical protein
MALIGTKRDKRDKLLFEPYLRGEEMKREMHEIIANYDVCWFSLRFSLV